MSKENVKQMFGKMEKDAELQKKYAALMQAHTAETEKALSDKLVELGKTAGFAFSKDDLMAARAELVDKANSNKELSEGDLASVAGGSSETKHDAETISVYTFGIGCAITSIVKEAQSHGGCAEYMSTNKGCEW